jgi:hypothetical protein
MYAPVVGYLTIYGFLLIMLVDSEPAPVAHKPEILSTSNLTSDCFHCGGKTIVPDAIRHT